MKFIFSIEAFLKIILESFRENISGVETGGILVGPRSHKNIITDVINSGEHAERRASTYYQSQTDVNFLNRKLKEFQVSGIDFKGYWHKHPRGMSQLSGGDITTCKEILTSPNYRINNFLIMSIVTETNTQKFPLFAYVTTLDNDGKVVVIPAQYSVMPKRCITEFVKCFLSTNIGGLYENINHRQSYNRTYACQTDNFVRSSGERNNNSKFSQKEIRAQGNRGFSTPKGNYPQASK
jgi:hypothetical protein